MAEPHMATRGAIARLTSVLPLQWAGCYHHNASDPTSLGATLWELYHAHFERDLDRLLSAVLDAHPAGWSYLNSAPDEEGSLGLCYCHGERTEAAWLVTHEDAAGAGVEWAYVFTSCFARAGEGSPLQRYNTLLVLASYRASGQKMVGMFGQGDPHAVWRIAAVVDLQGPEPDWEEIEQMARSRVEPSELAERLLLSPEPVSPKPVQATVEWDASRRGTYCVTLPAESSHYVAFYPSEHGKVQVFCTCAEPEDAPSADCPHARAVTQHLQEVQNKAQERHQRGLRYSGAWRSTDEEGHRRTEVLVWEEGQPRPLDPAPSLRLYNHSPSGFAWGYIGSGPAQLALALLFDFCGNEETALAHYQAFKSLHVASWPQENAWELDGAEVEAFLDACRIVAEDANTVPKEGA